MSALEKKTILRYETRIAELKRKIAAIDLQKQVYQSEIDKTQKAVEAIKGLEEPVEVPTIPIEWASPTNGQVREPACSTITSASDRACKEIDDGRGILESAG